MKTYDNRSFAKILTIIKDMADIECSCEDGNQHKDNWTVCESCQAGAILNELDSIAGNFVRGKNK